MAENKKSAVDQVYEDIFHLIVDGGYAPRDKLPSENELRQQFNVSRNTIRAALNRLRALGIVETQKGGGTHLCGFGTHVYLNAFVPSILSVSHDLLGLMMFRRGIEVSSARLAAMNATRQDLQKMEEYFEYLKRDTVSTNEFAESTSDFHVKIAIASKNELLVQILENIKWIITAKMSDFLIYKPDVADSSYYHYMIFRCIKHRKPEEAAFMMDRHMDLLIARVEDYLKSNGKATPLAAGPIDSVLSRTVTHIYDKKEDQNDEECT